MFGFKLKRRRADLARTLSEDLTQPPGWDGWLQQAESIKTLHASCPHPGWLVYCAYWDGVSQDKILDAALAVAQMAAERDPAAPVSARVMTSLRDDDGPDLGDLILSLEHHPLTRALVDMLPGQLNFTLAAAVSDGRIALRENDAPATLDLGPFRADPGAQSEAELAALAAAAYVLTIEALFHHSQRLRETLAIRAAAAAALLCGSTGELHDEALATARRIYGW